MLILMICSLCDYVWGVYAAISSPIMVLRTILVDFGELLWSYFGAKVVTWGVTFYDFGGYDWGCISDLVLGVVFGGF